MLSGESVLGVFRCVAKYNLGSETTVDIQCNYMRQFNYWDLITNNNIKDIFLKDDVVGKQYGRLIVISPVCFNLLTNKHHKCLAQCQCGSKISHYNLYKMRSGHTQSCGCYQSDRSRETQTTHGLCANKLYYIWDNMMTRCYYSKSKSFNNYMKIGITVCDEWHNVNNFVDWGMSHGYEDGLQIDRIDPAGNYDPDNVRWVNRHQQACNKRGRQTNATSQFKGVSWSKNTNKWYVQIRSEGILYRIGLFDDEKDAARAYNEAAKKYHKEYAYLNKIDED